MHAETKHDRRREAGGRVVSNGAYRARTGDLLLANKNVARLFTFFAVKKRLFPADTEGDDTGHAF